MRQKWCLSTVQLGGRNRDRQVKYSDTEGTLNNIIRVIFLKLNNDYYGNIKDKGKRSSR